MRVTKAKRVTDLQPVREALGEVVSSIDEGCKSNDEEATLM
jgi:hypothetical protein